MEKIYDVLVIGAGVVGAAVADVLARYDVDVAVLEKSASAGAGTTKANSAIVHAGYDCHVGTMKAKMNVRGNAMYPALSEELDVPFDNSGSLVVAFSEEEMETVHALYEQGIANGCDGMEILDAAGVKAREPNLSDEIVGALYSARAGVTDPFLMCMRLLDRAILNGAEIELGAEVTGLREEKDCIVVETTKGERKAHYVVNCAGLYSDRIMAFAGDTPIEINPTAGEYRMVEAVENPEVRSVIFQTPTKAGKGVLVARVTHGNYIVGPTAEKRADKEDTETTDEGIAYLDRFATKSVPALNFARSIRVFTGMRAKPTNGDFTIRASETMPHVIHAAGIESPGLASAPAIGEYVRELLEEAGLALPEKEHVTRLSRRTVMHDLSYDERAKKIAENPKFGKIICRCEGISEGEIVEAIHAPLPATTVDAVKRRVRAGMGRCQGGFCQPRVLEILSRELGVAPEHILKEDYGSEIVIGHLKEDQ